MSVELSMRTRGGAKVVLKEFITTKASLCGDQGFNLIE